MRMHLCAASACLIAALAAPVEARVLDSPRAEAVQLSDEILGHAGVTWFDLVKQVIPDLTREGDEAIGHRNVVRGHITGDASAGAMPATIRLGPLRAVPFTAEGKSRLALLIGIAEGEDMGEQPAVLAVFDDRGLTPALVDAVDVGMDRFTSFADPARVRIGTGDDAILTHSGHFNADETYDTTALIFLSAGKLSLIDSFSAYASRTCTLNTSQGFSFTAGPEARSPYYAITVTMRDIGERSADGCAEERVRKPYARSATTVYRWNAAKGAFNPDSDAVRRLQQETAAR